MGAAEHGAVRGTGEHEPAREQRGQTEQDGAGAAEQLRNTAAERVPDGAAVLAAERDHQPDRRDQQPGAERLHVEESAAEEHQGADDHEREGRHVGGRPDHVAEARFDLLADDTALPAQVEQRGEEEADGDEPEARSARDARGRREHALSSFVVRFFTREGVRGRSGRFFFLAAMEARSTPNAPDL